MDPKPATLNGSVERVTYHSEESGYCVLKVKAHGHRELVTVVGTVPAINGGEYIEAIGEWTQHREFGRQLKADSLRAVPPSTREGIERYLGSGLIKGIGPAYAKRLVEEFGEDVFDVIEKKPEKLARVSGIGPARRKRIVAAWHEQRVVRDIMVFLQAHGVGTSRAARIFKTYGADAIETVKADPYRLARDVAGIGFKGADKIAAQLGIPRDSLERARAGIAYVLQQKIGEGHCAYPEGALRDEAVTLLEIPAERIEEAVRLEVGDFRLIRETIDEIPCLFPVPLYRHEVQVATLLHRLSLGLPPWYGVDPEKAVPWAQGKLGLELAERQRDAVAAALKEKVLVLTGGPGTGKTTITRAILAVLEAKKMRVALCSPTGRAAKRLAEVSGSAASTIHRLLGYDRSKNGFQHDAGNPLDVDCLLVDEASMVDLPLMAHLLAAVPPRAGVLIVGDADQIPSVGPGAVLAAMLSSGVIPKVTLTEVFRQAAASQIVANAHRVNRGEVPAAPVGTESDFYFVAAETEEEALKKVLEFVVTRVPGKFGLDPVRDIQVLCPMNRGILGTRNLNVELQKRLNGNAETAVERYGNRYAPGDKVMVIQNDYDKDVFNGDIGFVLSVDKEEQQIRVDFDGRDIGFELTELDTLVPAYATTIHKAQGSEYPVVVLPLTMGHALMLRRNLLYTGITRGKKLVLLVGQRRALAHAVRASSDGRRWTKLADRLIQCRAQSQSVVDES